MCVCVGGGRECVGVDEWVWMYVCEWECVCGVNVCVVCVYVCVSVCVCWEVCGEEEDDGRM